MLIALVRPPNMAAVTTRRAHHRLGSNASVDCIAGGRGMVCRQNLLDGREAMRRCTRWGRLNKWFDDFEARHEQTIGLVAVMGLPSH
jgi:hypothetical protein